MKRKLTEEQARDIVRARLTKGSAFLKGPISYTVQQDQVKAELSTMSIDELKRRYPNHTYDFR